MDLINSVTQNSNNTEVPMENQGSGDDESRFNNDTSSSNKNDSNMNQQLNLQQGNSGEESMSHEAASKPHQYHDVVPAQKSQVPDYLKIIGMDPRKFWPKKYRFTREKAPGQYNPMSIAQRNYYEANGYLVIDDCAPKKLLDSIRDHHKESSIVNEFLVDKLVAKNGKLLQYVKCFCDEKIMLMTHQLIKSFQAEQKVSEVIDNKQVQRQQLYRDWIYLPFRPIDKVVCAITAIEPIEHVLLVVPGTHRVGQCTVSSTLENISAAYDSSQEKSTQLREIFECSPEKMSTLVDKSKKGFRYVNLKPGQTLFYHPGLVHGFSDDLINFRKIQLATIAYYAAADCEYVDLRKSPEFMTQHQVPLSLAHFGDLNPSDYNSWIDKPILLRDSKASL